MNLTMYSDSEKNLVMFLPDTVTPDEILALGEFSFPDEMYYDDQYPLFSASMLKPTSCINLYNTHACYEVSSIFPDSFVSPSL